MADGVIVLSKAAALLDALASNGELSPPELASLLGEPRSSIYRLLRTLETLGYVEPGSRPRCFQLGMELVALGNAVLKRFGDVRAAALPALERLYEETRQTIFLIVPRGFDGVCLERIDGEFVQVMILSPGGSIPLHAGAATRSLLAFMDRTVWEDLVAAGPLERFSDRTPTTRRALFRELEQIRAQGYAVGDEDVIPGIASIGAPIFDYTGQVCAALSASGPRPTVLDDANAFIEYTCRAAEDASRRLGFAALSAV
jgi:DNA-binding IclR family transcriptional regulator